MLSGFVLCWVASFLIKCWLHQMLRELEFLKNRMYLTPLERWGIFNRSFKRYRDQHPNNFDFYFSDEKFAAMGEGNIKFWNDNFF